MVFRTNLYPLALARCSILADLWECIGDVIPCGKTVLVHALVAAVRTMPKPTVLPILDGVDEEFANLISRRLRIPIL